MCIQIDRFIWNPCILSTNQSICVRERERERYLSIPSKSNRFLFSCVVFSLFFLFMCFLSPTDYIETNGGNQSLLFILPNFRNYSITSMMYVWLLCIWNRLVGTWRNHEHLDGYFRLSACTYHRHMNSPEEKRLEFHEDPYKLMSFFLICQNIFMCRTFPNSFQTLN